MNALLLEGLLGRAFRSGEELAWAAEDAVAVVDRVAAAGCATLGIEVWIPSVPGPRIPTPNIYTWSAPARRAGEAWIAYVAATSAAAKLYMQNFAWSLDDSDVIRAARPYFNLTVTQEDGRDPLTSDSRS